MVGCKRQVYSLLMVLSIVISDITCCKLKGDLCLWNIDGFEHIETTTTSSFGNVDGENGTSLTGSINYDTIIDEAATSNGSLYLNTSRTPATTFNSATTPVYNIEKEDSRHAYLKTTVPYSSLQSLIYENVTTPHCQLNITYKSNNTKLHLYQVVLTPPLQGNYTADNLTMSVSNTNRREQLLATLHSTADSRWQTIPVLLAQTDEPFRLIFVTESEYENRTDISLSIESLYYNHCDPDLVLPLPTGCEIVNSTICSGWMVKNQKPDQKYSWKVQDDYYLLDNSVEPSGTLWTNIETPHYPYNPAAKICQMSFSYWLEGYIRPFQAPTIVVHDDQSGRRTRFHQLPKGQGMDRWITHTFKLTRDLNGQETNNGRFHVKIVSYSKEKKEGGLWKIRNITFSDDCFPAPSTKSPASYMFHPCGSTGRSGPTQKQCETLYNKSSPKVNVNVDDVNMPGVQVWKVQKEDNYDLILFGASGGFGAETASAPYLVRGFKYVKESLSPTAALDIDLPIWPQRVHVKVKLYEKDKLYIVAGQAGGMACEDDVELSPGCRDKNGTKSLDGGGGGGGGASIVVLERNGEFSLLAVAGGGGGMGRTDMPIGFDYIAALKQECIDNQCNDTTTRPGYGGSYKRNNTFLVQDGRNLYWPFSGSSLTGGSGCSNYHTLFDTYGGFGGGGGGCAAGGGGGGYEGGNVSRLDDADVPGSGGTPYYNADLVERIKVDYQDPFHIYHPHGSVEITPIPPPCNCPGDSSCRWKDPPDYTEFDCLCGSTWIPSMEVELHLEECTNTQELPLYAEIAIAGAVFLLLFIAILCIYILCRRRQRKRRLQNRPNKEVIHLGYNHIYHDTKMPHVVPEERLQIVSHLGEGKFSQVFEARLALSDAWNSEEVTVAVKKPCSNSNTEQAREEFIREAQTINSFDHTNIMKILGICYYADRSIGIVMDVLKGGDLRSFLKERKPTPGMKAEEKLTHWDLMRIATEISSACKYLEEMKFIHRDIAARNVLLTEKGGNRVAKISDFGLSRDVINGDYWSRSRPTAVPVRWYPPEAVHTFVQSSKSDVWSYGVLLWEIYTFGEYPYPGKDHGEVAHFITQGGTMDPPSDCPPLVADIMRKCWVYEPTDRPFFSFIYLQLSRHLETRGMKPSPVADPSTNNKLRTSVTSSSSSGFEEALESPTSLSTMPLIGHVTTSGSTRSSDQGFSEAFGLLVHEQSVSSFDV